MKKLLYIFAALTFLPLSVKAGAPAPHETACNLELSVLQVSDTKPTVIQVDYDYVPNPGKRQDAFLTEFSAQVTSGTAIYVGFPLPPNATPEHVKSFNAEVQDMVQKAVPLCKSIDGHDIKTGYQFLNPSDATNISIKNGNRIKLSCQFDKEQVKNGYLKCGVWGLYG